MFSRVVFSCPASLPFPLRHVSFWCILKSPPCGAAVYFILWAWWPSSHSISASISEKFSKWNSNHNWVYLLSTLLLFQEHESDYHKSGTTVHTSNHMTGTLVTLLFLLHLLYILFKWIILYFLCSTPWLNILFFFSFVFRVKLFVFWWIYLL